MFHHALLLLLCALALVGCGTSNTVTVATDNGFVPFEFLDEQSGELVGFDIELIELNEAFASQSLAVIRELDLDQSIVNVNGGAIALGHPLGCTGSKLSVQLFNEMRRRGNKYGMVTMCVGTGQGAAGVYELLN